MRITEKNSELLALFLGYPHVRLWLGPEAGAGWSFACGSPGFLRRETCILSSMGLAVGGVMADGTAPGGVDGVRLDDLCPFLDCAGLTPRETESLLSILRGETAVKLAARMDVSPSTVGGYRLRAYKKLGVANRVGFQRLVRDRFGKDNPASSPSLRWRLF